MISNAYRRAVQMSLPPFLARFLLPSLANLNCSIARCQLLSFYEETVWERTDFSCGLNSFLIRNTCFTKVHNSSFRDSQNKNIIHHSFQLILLIEKSRISRKGCIFRFYGKTQGRDDDRIRGAYAKQLPRLAVDRTLWFIFWKDVLLT